MAADTGDVWSPPRIAGPVVVAAGSVVEEAALVVVGSTVVVGAVVVGAVVGSIVVVGAVVVGSTVVVGAVTVGWVVALNVDSACVVAVVPPAVAGVRAAEAGGVVTGPLRGSGTVSGMVVDARGEVRGSRVVVDADVGAGWVGRVVGSATPGARRGGGA